MVHLLQSTIVSNFFYCVECIHHTFAILPTCHNFWLIFANQLWTVHFGTWLIAKLFHSVHKKLRTCGADFEYYEVADLRLRTSRITKLRTSRIRKLRLRIQESWKVVADLRLQTKLLNVQLRTCGCGLRKLKFGCGFADCGRKKNLRCPALLICNSVLVVFQSSESGDVVKILSKSKECAGCEQKVAQTSSRVFPIYTVRKIMSVKVQF